MNLSFIILIIIVFPFFIWLIGYLNTWFFVPFFKEEDAKDFLAVHGCEFIASNEIKNDGRYKLQENIISKFYSFKTYYQIDASSTSDGSKKTFRLILRKSFRPFGYQRDLYFFEE